MEFTSELPPDLQKVLDELRVRFDPLLRALTPWRLCSKGACSRLTSRR
jgi:hypothetical protein